MYNGYGPPGANYTATNPAPQRGNGPFGAVPGPVGVPSAYNDLSGVYPSLTGTNSAASAAILAKLRGDLSPDTVAGIHEDAARFGVANGMPGSSGILGSLASNRGLRDLGLAKEAQVQSGINAYSSLIPAVSSTQTVRPETQIGVAENNAVNAAAPDPTAANTYAQQLFDKYLAKLSTPAGGTGSVAKSSRPWWAGPSAGSKIEHFMPGSNTPYSTTGY